MVAVAVAKVVPGPASGKVGSRATQSPSPRDLDPHMVPGRGHEGGAARGRVDLQARVGHAQQRRQLLGFGRGVLVDALRERPLEGQTRLAPGIHRRAVGAERRQQGVVGSLDEGDPRAGAEAGREQQMSRHHVVERAGREACLEAMGAQQLDQQERLVGGVAGACDQCPPRAAQDPGVWVVADAVAHEGVDGVHVGPQRLGQGGDIEGVLGQGSAQRRRRREALVEFGRDTHLGVRVTTIGRRSDPARLPASGIGTLEAAAELARELVAVLRDLEVAVAGVRGRIEALGLRPLHVDAPVIDEAVEAPEARLRLKRAVDGAVRRYGLGRRAFRPHGRPHEAAGAHRGPVWRVDEIEDADRAAPLTRQVTGDRRGGGDGS